MNKERKYKGFIIVFFPSFKKIEGRYKVVGIEGRFETLKQVKEAINKKIKGE